MWTLIRWEAYGYAKEYFVRNYNNEWIAQIIIIFF